VLSSLLLATYTWLSLWATPGCLLLMLLAAGGDLLRSLLLSDRAARGSSMLRSSCCGSGCACPRLMYDVIGLKLLLPGVFHCRLNGLLGEYMIRRIL
jgi:hypothetical protein